MKTTKLILASCLAFLLFASCKQWEVPALLIGKWESKQKVTVRTKEKGKYVFINAPDSILLQFSIDENGNVSGHLGDATLENCTVQKNRGEFGKALNLATDYVIKGNLKGAIFSADPYLTKEISAPFDVKNNKMEGSFFRCLVWICFPLPVWTPVKKNNIPSPHRRRWLPKADG
ncbi:MAG: hypothetical protein IPJ32_09430 [Sphingobacteriaceae bacterium]|nr:hypothetical protein [Sphingobacteriaceae bacterium]